MVVGKGKSSVESVQKEDIIQAVIVTDCYNENFFPATDVPPLLPLANRPLMDYTFECLMAAGVQEAIVFCSSNTDVIKKYLTEKRWEITFTVVQYSGSLGDALRDLDSRALIRGDFVLLTGNIVGNFQLKEVLEHHKKVQKFDKGAAMTLIYKECGKKARSDEDKIYLAIDNQSKRILLHQRLNSRTQKLQIPVEILMAQSIVDIRYDLLDTKVSVCSVSVPPLFSDNFDFQTRDDFVRGLLMNEEILASTVYSYILPPVEYVASITSWQNYHYICHDVLHRWTYPLVPDRCIDDSYTFKRNNIYLQDNVTLAQNCNLTEDSMIGKGTVIKENVVVGCTIIGKYCEIGANTTLSNSHLFSHVIVEEGCKLDFCVLGNSCIIKSGAVLSSCILGPGVIIEKGKIVKNMRLQATPSSLGESQSFGSKAFVYQDEDSDSESNSEECHDSAQWIGLKMEYEDIAENEYDSSDSEADVSEREASPILDDTNLFYSEVVDSFMRGYEDKVPCDNLVLEVNSSRYAYNVTVNEVNFFVVRAVLALKEDYTWDAIASKLKYFMPLLSNYIKNESAMTDCLSAIEDFSELNPPLRKVAMKLLHFLYDKDILSEHSILKWFNNPTSGSENSIKIRKEVAPFIKWLETAETSESEAD